MATTVVAPVTNSIGLAAKYLPLLDQVYKRGSLTSLLDTADARVQWTGAKTCNIFTLSGVGMANYDRNAGFVPGNTTGSWEPYALNIDRGRSYQVDTMDNEESLSLVVGNLLGETERHPDRHESRLHAVVEVAFETRALHFARPHGPRPLLAGRPRLCREGGFPRRHEDRAGQHSVQQRDTQQDGE